MPGESQSLINGKFRHCWWLKVIKVNWMLFSSLHLNYSPNGQEFVQRRNSVVFLGRIFLIILVQSHPLCFKINPLCLCQTQHTFPIVILRFSQGNCKTPFPLFCQHIIFWPPRQIATLPFQNEKFFKQLS